MGDSVSPAERQMIADFLARRGGKGREMPPCTFTPDSEIVMLYPGEVEKARKRYELRTRSIDGALGRGKW